VLNRLGFALFIILNSNEQHLKIPVNWQGVSWEHRNTYIAYLWVKRYSRFGRVHISNIPKRYFGHWVSKLISVGFMKRVGDYYVLISYVKVWSLLGVNMVKYRGKKLHRWRKLPKYYNTWGEFKKRLIEDTQGFQTERKKAQFRRRYSLAGSPKGVDHTPLFSAAAAAKLFGYKSRVTGGKYRNKFFDVVEEPLRLRKHLTSDQLPYFKFECKRVYINTIFHEG
jgi:hypothetical protein